MNTEKVIGFICGVGVALLLVWAVLKRSNTDGSTHTEYDERQKVIRGIGFKYGFYTLITYLFLLMLAEIAELKLPVSTSVIYFTGIVISGLVLSGYTIMHDAYWGLNNNIQFYTRFLMSIGVLNLIFGFAEMFRHQMIVGGILQDNFINFEAGILLAGIGVMLLIRSRQNRREEDGE
ncbi:MAG: hypothetical protein MJ127_05645 [Mogibacterium sp.]|nr:hypothetical protein [Mogibacterium sp.]